MDHLLKFKNKKYEAHYYGPVEPYLMKIVRACLISVIVVVPFLPYTLYVQWKHGIASVPAFVRRCILACLVYVILAVLVLAIYKYWDFLRKHRKFTRWSLDIFFNLVSGFWSFQFYDFNSDSSDPLNQFIYGWWECFLVISVFSAISRWYLKLTAFLIIIIRIGIGVYISTGSDLLLIKMFQMIALEILIIYYHEKDRRKFFIEKQHLHEETKAYKEIFDLTSDGVIIYGLQEGTLYRNWSNEKSRWWKTEDNDEQNFEKILLKGYKKVAQLSSDMEFDLNSLVQSANKMNFREFLKQLTQQLTQNLQNKQNTSASSGSIDLNSNPLKPGRLVLLTGSVERLQDNILPDSNFASSNTTYLLEIKVLYTIFKEKPSLALVFSDITERSLVTILQENNNYKNRLLASVSHELRTPLNASINFTQEAIDHPQLSEFSEVKENFLIPALRSSQLLLFLINDILDFSQMSANKLRLVYENKNVHETLDECLNLIRIQANRKGLKISADYKFDNEEFFCTDHNRLKQIVLNLLSNALKFTLEGEIKVTAKTSTLAALTTAPSEIVAADRVSDKFDLSPPKQDQKILSISISDTGIGISEENKGKLFKAFEKIDLGEKSVLNAQGVGLGLVISNNLVLSLGPGDASNSIKVDSELNKGTTFTFWIVDHQSESSDRERIHTSIRSEDLCSDMKERVHSDSEYENMETLHCFLPKKTLSLLQIEKKALMELEKFTTPRISNLSNIEESNLPKPPQILIVDDDIFNICALQMILSKCGYTCDAAYNGEQAIQKVLHRHSESRLGENKPSQYKVIFMDYNMPIMDGFEATRILKTKMRNKEIDPISIVTCTAFLTEDDKIRANEYGVDAFCMKPINKEKIADILKRYLPVKCWIRQTEASIPKYSF